ncbi:MAG: hypothetical protein JNN13_04425 [Planctomycetes bacterium]|nr:hypothetical protein [Planctomycetota bacterium]
MRSGNVAAVGADSPRLAVVAVRVDSNDAVHVVGRSYDFASVADACHHARLVAPSFAERHRCEVCVQVLFGDVLAFSATATAPLGVERWFGDVPAEAARIIRRMLAEGHTEATIARALREGGAS